MTSVEQPDLFVAPSFEGVTVVSTWRDDPPFFVVGCSQKKRRVASSAGDLYTSDRFKNARKLIKQLGAEFGVLSAKHGLVRSDTVLEPYDVKLSDMTPEDLQFWADRVFNQLPSNKKKICLLANDDYLGAIVRNLGKRKTPTITTPLSGIEERYHSGWFEQALTYLNRHGELEKLYDIIEVQRRRGAVFQLSDLSKADLPERGVYLFLDRNEENFRGSEPRIVRIGTHAVSKGSKSTLRMRLRNHFGRTDGGGNHRGSIFRLHVGSAILNLEGSAERMPSWGVGQHASKEILGSEVEFEKVVSGYLRKLEVMIIPIADEPGKTSLRAHVERQIIALCTEDYKLIDTPGREWLGHSSPVKSIDQSGLWNIRDVSTKYSSDGPGCINSVAELLGD